MKPRKATSGGASLGMPFGEGHSSKVVISINIPINSFYSQHLFLRANAL